jgi:serine/threonine protein kinase
MNERVGQDFSGNERFMIVRRIGAGGMGVVYEAFDRERKAKVALKTLPFADAAALYRFKQEFRSLADVVHANLVALYQLIADGDQWFFTMELVHGCTFLDYVRPRTPGSALTSRVHFTPHYAEISQETVDFRALPERALLGDAEQQAVRPTLMPAAHHDRLREALRQLAEGVCALHAAGKLHRDLKPSNVLVTPRGRVVILDFGLVTPLGQRAADDATDQGVAGTAAYMSPEQAAGQPLSEASDWYCVGAMLYQVLTGHPPFVGSKYQVMHDKQLAEPAFPAELAAQIPDDLREACQALLRMRPAERLTGAQLLRSLGAEGPTPAVGAPTPESARAPFVGRTVHLAVLGDALKSLVRHPVVVHVFGRSGAGKSFLLQHFRQDIVKEGDVVVL